MAAREAGTSLCDLSFPPMPSNSPFTREVAAENRNRAGRTFADLVLNQPIDVPTERKQAVRRFGRLQVSFSKEEIDRSTEPLKHTLIAKFNRNRPSVDEVKKAIRKFWKLEYEVLIGVIDVNHLILQFNGEGDYLKAWLRESHILNGIHFKVFPWSPTFTPMEESPLQPIWVNLNLLPLNLFNTDYLATIVSGLGKFLAVDHATKWRTRPSRARISVEMNLLGEFPKEIEIEMGLEKVIQPVSYEFVPFFCSRCKMRGHSLTHCKKGQNSNQNVNTEIGKTAESQSIRMNEKAVIITKEKYGVQENGQMETRGKHAKSKEKIVINKTMPQSTKQWVSQIFYKRPLLGQRGFKWVPKKKTMPLMLTENALKRISKELESGDKGEHAKADGNEQLINEIYGNKVANSGQNGNEETERSIAKESWVDCTSKENRGKDASMQEVEEGELIIAENEDGNMDEVRAIATNPMMTNPKYMEKTIEVTKKVVEEMQEDSDSDIKSQPETVKRSLRGKEFSSDSEIISIRRKNRRVAKKKKHSKEDKGAAKRYNRSVHLKQITNTC